MQYIVSESLVEAFHVTKRFVTGLFEWAAGNQRKSSGVEIRVYGRLKMLIIIEVDISLLPKSFVS